MIKEAIVKIVNKEDLTYDEAYTVMNEIMSGETTPTQNAAFLSALADDALPVVLDGECTGRYAFRQFADHLFPVCEQVAALAASLSFGAAQYLVERVRHVGVFRYLLHDMAFPAHKHPFGSYNKYGRQGPSFLRV